LSVAIRAGVAVADRKRRYEWDSIRTLGSNRLVQVSVVLPVIGYLLLFSGKFQSYYVLFIDAHATEPVFWRLYFLYFGFWSFAVASALYAWKCPETIKAHGAGYEFAEREGPSMSNDRVSRIRDALVDSLPEKIRAHGEYAYKRLNSLTRDEILVEHFVALKQQGAGWRIATRSCYDLGFLLLFIPSVHVLYSVLRRLIG
jgi:hypothetical protein